MIVDLHTLTQQRLTRYEFDMTTQMITFQTSSLSSSQLLMLSTESTVINLRIVAVNEIPAQSSEVLVGESWVFYVPLLALSEIFVYTISVHVPYKYKLIDLLSQRRSIINIFSKYLTSDWLRVTIISKKAGKVQLKAKQAVIIYSQREAASEQVDIAFLTNKEISIANTKVLSKWDEELESNAEKQLNYNSTFAKYYSQLAKEINKVKQVASSEQIVITELTPEVVAYQQYNIIASLSKREQMKSSRAGQKRVETILFRDSFGNFVKPTQDFFDSLFCQFVHQAIPHFVYNAHIHVNQDGLSVDLAWQPITKGFYTLFINHQPLKTKFVVLANAISPLTSTVQLQENNKRSFFDKNLAVFTYKDEYSNIFGDIEKNVFEYANEVFKLQINTDKMTSITAYPKMVDKTGQQNVDFVFETELVDNVNNDQPTLRFFIKDTLVKGNPPPLLSPRVPGRHQRHLPRKAEEALPPRARQSRQHLALHGLHPQASHHPRRPPQARQPGPQEVLLHQVPGRGRHRHGRPPARVLRPRRQHHERPALQVLPALPPGRREVPLAQRHPGHQGQEQVRQDLRSGNPLPLTPYLAARELDRQ